MTTTNQDELDPRPPVVVGLDDSPSGRAALAWAAEQARLTAQPLRAVHVAHISPVGGYGALPTGGLGPVGAAPGAAGQLGPLAEIPRRAAAPDPGPGPAAAPPASIQLAFDAVDPGPEWTLEVVESADVSTALLDRASGAALLVLGTGEHTGLSRLTHGSVSHQCLSHATVPVTAVPLPGGR